MQNDPAGAIAALQPSLKYELSYNFSFNSLYPAYIPAWLTGEGRFGSGGVSEIAGSQGFGGKRRDWGASTFADRQGAENDVRRSLCPASGMKISWLSGRTPMPMFPFINEPKPSTRGWKKRHPRTDS